MTDNSNSNSAQATTTSAAASAAAAAFHALHTSPHQVPGAATTTTTASADGVRGPYRGKCLYKTGKCPNERALKTSGAAHNLCDEHRRRQNEHQRKLDSKNRFSRKDKRGSSSSASADAALSQADTARGYERTSVKHAATDPAAAAEAAAVAAKGIASDTLAHLAAANGSLHALAPPYAAPASTAAAAPPSQLPMASSDASTKAYASNGAQPPQMTSYPYMVQDFDGIMVPLPSCFEGHERVEVRARVYQKVLDYISEECIRLYRGKAMSDGGYGAASPVAPTTSHLQLPRANGGAAMDSGSAAAAPTGVYFAPHQIVQQQHQHHVMPSERGEKRGADTDTSLDGDGAVEREQRTLKKPQRATARTARDRPAKHPRTDM